jgi:hypothetical protein
MTIREHYDAWNRSPKYIETYRGVILYKGENRHFPFNGLGIVWASKSLDALKDYIDKALDTNRQSVNDRGALMFNA